MPADFDSCMAKDWPGITDKGAFCAWLSHQQTGKWPAEKNREAFSLNLPIAKFDDKNGEVTGWAALSTADDKPLIDFHDELILVEELEKAAHGVMLEGGAGKAGEMHVNRVGDIVESMVMSKEKAAALGLGDAKMEGWIVTLKLRDKGAIERVKNGDRPELSLHGMAKKITVGKRDGKDIKALVDLSVDEVSIVDNGASGNDDAKPEIVIAKRREQEAPGLGTRFVSQIKKIFGKASTMTLDEILAELGEEKAAVILAAIETAAKPAAPAPVAPEVPVVVPVANAEEPKPEMTEEETAKALAALPESVRKQLDDGKGAAEEVAKIRKELDEKNDREEVAKFADKADKLEFLAGKSKAEIAKLLRAASNAMPAKEYDAIEKLLSDANVAVEGSPLFDDKGGRGNDSEMTALGKIKAIAKKLRESDSSLTPEQAVVKARDENPELRKTYDAELSQA